MAQMELGVERKDREEAQSALGAEVAGEVLEGGSWGSLLRWQSRVQSAFVGTGAAAAEVVEEDREEGIAAAAQVGRGAVVRGGRGSLGEEVATLWGREDPGNEEQQRQLEEVEPTNRRISPRISRESDQRRTHELRSRSTVAAATGRRWRWRLTRSVSTVSRLTCMLLVGERRRDGRKFGRRSCRRGDLSIR
jgi:hypothetical protein